MDANFDLRLLEDFNGAEEFPALDFSSIPASWLDSPTVGSSSTDASQMDPSFSQTPPTDPSFPDQSFLDAAFIDQYFLVPSAMDALGMLDDKPVIVDNAPVEPSSEYPILPPLDPRMDLCYPLVHEEPATVTPTTENIEQFFTCYNLPLETHLKYFQIIDSIKYHFSYTDVVPSSSQFRFDDDVKLDARVFQSWLVDVYHIRDSSTDIDRMERYRPQMPSLPIIPAMPVASAIKSASLAPVQHDQGRLPSFAELAGHPADGPPRQLLVQSAAHARQLRQQYQAVHNKTGRTSQAFESFDVPRDDASYLAHIDRLFDAIMDFSTCLEKGKKAHRTKKRKVDDVEKGDKAAGDEDGVQAQRVKNAPKVVVEMAASEILDAAIEAHIGNVWINNWTGLNGWAYEQFDTFEDRFNYLCHAVKNSKAIIDNVMKFSPLRRLAAAPAKEYIRKYTNMTINKVRDQQNAAGIHAIKSGQVTVDKDTDAVYTPDGKVLVPAMPQVPPPAEPAKIVRPRKTAKKLGGAKNPTA